MEQSLSPATRLLIKYRRPLVVLSQQVMVWCSNYAAFWLRFDGNIPPLFVELQAQTIWALIAIRLIVFTPLGLHEGLWRYAGIWDLRNIIIGIAGSSLAFYVVVNHAFSLGYPRSIFLIDAILLVVLMGGARLTRRIHRELSLVNRDRRVLVIGAGDAGEMIVRQMKQDTTYNAEPIGFVDDDPRKVGLSIHGVPVLATTHNLSKVVTECHPTEVLIAIPGAESTKIRALVRILEPFKIPIKTLPNIRHVLNSRVDVSQIRDLNIEDLLSRSAVGLESSTLHHLIAGKCVMVTGAGGSIGSELCRQIATLGPASLVMFERYENSLHEIRVELSDKQQPYALHPIIGDVTDPNRVAEVLREHRPDIIFHAAAHKHVPLMEENPCEAVKNNVRGTRLLAEAAEQCGVDRFVLISTDKAVNPTSVMGTSKRIAEMIVHARAQQSLTSFSIVRFGNVLGSNGSVVPRFMDQIRRGGPVTITHPDMKRFFMLIPEAVQLVLHAAAQADSGSTYVLEMGEQVRLVDMARDLIRLSGLVPDEDIKIEFIGLRPGEKLYEELVAADEDASKSQVEKVLCVRSRSKPAPDVFSRVEAIETHAIAGRIEATLASMRELAGTFVESSPQRIPDTPEAPEAPPVLQPAPGAPAGPQDLQPCPACRHAYARRSRARSVPERIRRGLTTSRLYRCEACGWRGWLTPQPFDHPAASDFQPSLDLVPLDSAVKPAATDRRPIFSPRDL